MKAAVLEKIGKIKVSEVKKPVPATEEVLVRIKACGICQTDYSAYTGRRANLNFPMILGHEMSGIIEEIGDGVCDWQVSDEVIISPVVYCGKCYNCRIGKPHYCQYGQVLGGEGQPVIRDGGFAEYIVVPTSVIYRKPENISFESAALTEPLAGSYKGLIEYSNMTVGEDVVIIGVGSMGLLVNQVAKAGGAGNIIAIDKNDVRLKKAGELGANHCLRFEENMRKRIFDILREGPDIVFEAAGTLEAARLTFDLLRRGTRINMFGVILPGTIEISPASIHFQETRMDASFSITPRVMEKAIGLMRKSLVDPGKIITHRFALEDIDRAMEAMESPDRIKIIILP
ncbi:MAG: alcohol dehydrogenase catalytic domain-containing protein [Actinobacteria bacterium]|nr:alcohol dehydrogenase catalytic domain-containing protein [Actinomycetota bacterium]